MKKDFDTWNTMNQPPLTRWLVGVSLCNNPPSDLLRIYIGGLCCVGCVSASPIGMNRNYPIDQAVALVRPTLTANARMISHA